jgi:hypothetical protein
VQELAGEPLKTLDKKPTKELQKWVFRHPGIWVIAISSAFIYITQHAVSDWGVLFLQKQKTFSLESATQIIGISGIEQEIVACVVRFNHERYSYQKLIAEQSPLGEEQCMTIARLTAILRVANALDRSHRRKFDDLQIRIQDRKMYILVETGEDISLEKGLFSQRADFFEEVFGIRPVIKQKKR